MVVFFSFVKFLTREQSILRLVFSPINYKKTLGDVMKKRSAILQERRKQSQSAIRYGTIKKAFKGTKIYQSNEVEDFIKTIPTPALLVNKNYGLVAINNALKNLNFPIKRFESLEVLFSTFPVGFKESFFNVINSGLIEKGKSSLKNLGKIEHFEWELHPYYRNKNLFGAILFINENYQYSIDLLKNKIKDLKAAKKRLETLNYFLHHDIKSPLRFINYSLQEIKKGKEFNKKNLSIIENNIQNIQAIIEDFPLSQEICEKKQKFRLININNLVQKVLKALSPLLEEIGAKIIIQNPLPSIVCDKNQILRLFLNILENSIKFRVSRPLEITILSKEVEGFFFFSIQDNGKGLDPSFYLKKISESARLNPHCNLGLFICGTIIRNHGGTLEYKNNKEGGLNLSFSIKKIKREK